MNCNKSYSFKCEKCSNYKLCLSRWTYENTNKILDIKIDLNPILERLNNLETNITNLCEKCLKLNTESDTEVYNSKIDNNKNKEVQLMPTSEKSLEPLETYELKTGLFGRTKVKKIKNIL